MRIIAECSSSKSIWAMVDGNNVVERVVSSGINPFFQTRREISHAIRLELPDSFFRRRWEHVHIYCAGCTTDEKIKMVEASAVAQFKSPVTVESDLIGAARGLLGERAGIVCILGTGSNSCQYDGYDIEKQVRSLGFILGDEGSSASLGRLLVSDCLKGVAPKRIMEQFFDKYTTSADEIMEEIYNTNTPNKWLSVYSDFLSKRLKDSYVNELVKTELKRFFTRNILQYDYKDYPVSFVGEVACRYSRMIQEIADELGIAVDKIEESSISGLIAYHARNGM